MFLEFGELFKDERYDHIENNNKERNKHWREKVKRVVFKPRFALVI